MCLWFKKNINFAIVVIVYLIFLKPLFLLQEKSFVKPIFSKVPESFFSDMLIISLALLSLFSITNYFKPSLKIDKKFYKYLAFLSVFYAVNRFYGYWDFKTFTFCKNVAYFDFLVLIPVWFIIREVKRKKKPKERPDSIFLEDLPATLDTLGYKEYANKVAKSIEDKKFQKAFAIGINGAWGTGKTSLMNFIEDRLDKQKTLIVKFNPWRTMEDEQLIIDFFETLGNELSKEVFSIKSMFRKYTKFLIGYDKGPINNLLQRIKTEETATEIFKEIESSVVDIDKQIIVFIDDLDRLSKSEINIIIKLIRNSANFPNFIYIVSYDKQYVLNAIKEINEHNYSKFLEKIFQLEINLPSFDRLVLKEYFIKNIEEKFGDKYSDEVKNIYSSSFDYYSFTENSFLYDYITNYREANRLINSLILNFNESVLQEVVFEQFLRVEILRLEYPIVYDYVKQNRADFLWEEKNQLVLKKVGQILYDQEDTEEFVILKKLNEFEHLSERDKENVMSIFQPLFSDKKDGIQDLSIQNPSKYHIYFKYSLRNNVLSEKEYLQVFSTGNLDSLISLANKSIEGGYSRDLVLRLIRMDNINAFNRISHILRTIFHIVKQLHDQSSSHHHYLFEDDIVKFMIKKYNDTNQKDKSFRFLDYFYSAFEQAEKPFLFPSNVIFALKKEVELENKLPLYINDLNNFNYDYFNEYLKSKSELDSVIWRLYWNCRGYKWTTNESGHKVGNYTQIPEDIKLTMQSFILQVDPVSFIQNNLIQEPEGIMDNYFLEKDFVDVFDDFKTLQSKFLNESRLNEKEKSEFQMFLTKFESNNFRTTEFSFKSFRIHRHWVRG